MKHIALLLICLSLVSVAAAQEITGIAGIDSRGYAYTSSFELSRVKDYPSPFFRPKLRLEITFPPWSSIQPSDWFRLNVKDAFGLGKGQLSLTRIGSRNVILLQFKSHVFVLVPSAPDYGFVQERTYSSSTFTALSLPDKPTYQIWDDNYGYTDAQAIEKLVILLQ